MSSLLLFMNAHFFFFFLVSNRLQVSVLYCAGWHSASWSLNEKKLKKHQRAAWGSAPILHFLLEALPSERSCIGERRTDLTQASNLETGHGSSRAAACLPPAMCKGQNYSTFSNSVKLTPWVSSLLSLHSFLINALWLSPSPTKGKWTTDFQPPTLRLKGIIYVS